MAQRVTVRLSREFLGRESKSNQLVVSVKSFGEPPQLSIIVCLSLPFRVVTCSAYLLGLITRYGHASF